MSTATEIMLRARERYISYDDLSPWMHALLRTTYELILDVMDEPQIAAMIDDGCPLCGTIPGPWDNPPL